MSFVNKENTNNRPDGKYSDVIKDISESEICPFCPEHLRSIHPKPITNETEFWLGSENAYPYDHTKHHMLVIHKAHIEHIRELPPDAWVDLDRILEEIIEEREIQGATLIMRFGSTALTGASVSHLHAQLVSGTGERDSPPVLARVG